jgi:hypothetical protein
MRESRTYGSVRGARGNSRPYRDVRLALKLCSRCDGHHKIRFPRPKVSWSIQALCGARGGEREKSQVLKCA